MKSLIGLFANGGAVANVWQRVPFYVKAPVVVGVVLMASVDLVRDINIGFRSGRVAEGQAVDADAKIADPDATRAAVLAGKPVTGAERQIAAQIAGLDADADQKRAAADAATESDDEILEKWKNHKKLTTTEKLRLREVQIKDKELAIREQELRIKAAEASAADSSAAVKNTINGMILGDNGLDAVIDGGKRRADCATPQLGGCVDSNGLDSFGRVYRQVGSGNLAGRMMDKTAPKALRRRDPGQVVRGMEGRISDPFQ
jgi:hypothetical protein